MKNTDKLKTPVMNLYTIHDIVAGRFNPPFLSENHNAAKRIMSQLVNDPNSVISKTPADYKLYYIGDYDQDDGQLDALDTFDLICSGHDFIIDDNN